MFPMSTNVLGQALQTCCGAPITGFYRDGFCRTGAADAGQHTVCAVMTQEFLDYSRAQGNDLSVPMPASGFPGLRPGDRWCVCARRWAQAFAASVAPPVVLQATNKLALDVVQFDDLFVHAVVEDVTVS